jgi:hypothetical protein
MDCATCGNQTTFQQVNPDVGHGQLEALPTPTCVRCIVAKNPSSLLDPVYHDH